MCNPRFMVLDAPSQPQSIDIEKWKQERNDEMGKLPTITMYKEGGKKVNINDTMADEYLEKGWSRTPVVDKPKSVTATSNKPTVSKPTVSKTTTTK